MDSHAKYSVRITKEILERLGCIPQYTGLTGNGVGSLHTYSERWLITLSNPRGETITWSIRSIPKSEPACKSCLVTIMSASLGSRFPEG